MTALAVALALTCAWSARALASGTGTGTAAATTTTATTTTATTTATAASAPVIAPDAAAAMATEATEPVPGNPVLISELSTRPSGYRLTAGQVLAIARRDPRVIAELRKRPHAIPYVYTKGVPWWQVSWFSDTSPEKEVIQVYVNDNAGLVAQVWTGFQVAWSMARGYSGAFGRRVNALYLWIPLCVLFLAPFIPWPRTGRRWSLLHLDLVMLLGFSISLAFFNHANIGMSVPLVYPFLVYLLARMTLLAFGRGIPRTRLEPVVPVPWLWIGVVFLMAFRIGLNILNSNVIDVGYAGVIGADKLIHGVPLYGNWPHDNLYGDTYGPVNYFTYVPFRLIFGWSGVWDSLPAAHAASIFFDLATFGGLILLGRRLRGGSLPAVLAYLWAAYPFTLYAMNSNTNDALVGALLVLALLVIGSAPARGAVGSLAGLTKFAPFALMPLLLRGVGPPPRERSVAAFILAAGVTVFVCMLPVLLNHDLGPFWHDSIKYQADRTAPFSIWGLWGGLGAVQHILQGVVISIALLFAFFPERRGVVEVAALAAAILISLQIVGNYWLYPYIVWFYPLVLIALLAAQHHPSADAGDALLEPPADEPEPIPIRIISPTG